MSDRVTLSVPARSEFAKTVRMTAAQLASRMDMSFDEVEDVRLAAEEAFIYASETYNAGEAVTIDFDLDEGSLAMSASLGSGSALKDDEAHRRDSYAGFILESICDEFELVTDSAAPQIRVAKIKGSESADAS